jgi:serine/threonine-protein kinase
MRPHPPAHKDVSWATLRDAGLLDGEALRRLAAAGKPRLAQLVRAGLLTAYQARQVRRGKAQRLRLGPYRILDRLGAGGSARVYKAEHVLMKRLVALKVLGRVRQATWAAAPPGATPAPAAQRCGEPENAGRLAHPHVVTAYDAARLRGRLVLVLEYVEGVDLQRLLEQTGPLPPALAREVARQAALALDHLHGRGLVHRDVKPANLLLAGEASARAAWPPLVKLIDLGLTCPAGETDGGGLSGTLDYIAPERGTGADVADIRGDLYSLGCTLYHLLTGRPPFPGGSWTGKLIRHRLEEPDPVQALRPEVPDDLAAVVRRLMARAPEDRYPDPAALLAALDERQRPPAHAAPPPPPRRFTGLAPWVLLATVLTGGAVGGVARMSVAPAGRPAAPVLSPVPDERPRQQPGGVTVSGIDRPFATLAEAVAAARDGGVLTLHGKGPFRTPPLNCRGKALTLRAAAGDRPVVEREETPAGAWEAMLASDRPLTLRGLVLHAGAGAAPAAAVEGAALRLTGCQVRGPALGPALALRQGSMLLVEDCQVTAPRQGLAVEAAAGRACKVVVRGSTLEVLEPAGAAVLAWAPERTAGARVDVELNGSALRGGRVIACRCVAGPLHVAAERCRLGFRQALVSFDGCGARAERGLRWSGRGNTFEAGAAWLRVEGVARDRGALTPGSESRTPGS